MAKLPLARNLKFTGHVKLGRPSPAAGLSKREIFYDEVVFAARKRAITSAARYLAISGF